MSGSNFLMIILLITTITLFESYIIVKFIIIPHARKKKIKIDENNSIFAVRRIAYLLIIFNMVIFLISYLLISKNM